MALRLHRPAHHSEAHLGLAPAHGEARDDGVERAFSGANGVDVARLRSEATSAILQANSCPGNYDSRAEAHVVGLDVGAHHPRLVCGGEIDGPSRPWHAVSEIARPMEIDQCRPGF